MSSFRKFPILNKKGSSPMKRRTFISLMSVMAAAGVLSLAGCSSNTSASTASSTAASASAAAQPVSLARSAWAVEGLTVEVVAQSTVSRMRQRSRVVLPRPEGRGVARRHPFPPSNRRRAARPDYRVGIAVEDADGRRACGRRKDQDAAHLTRGSAVLYRHHQAARAAGASAQRPRLPVRKECGCYGNVRDTRRPQILPYLRKARRPSRHLWPRPCRPAVWTCCAASI